MPERYGIVIDLERCIGCHACTIACRLENGFKRAGIRVDTIGGKSIDTASGKYPDLTMYYLPGICVHCEKPACQASCPMGAISKRDDGIVLVNKELCNGCEACISACAYGALSYNAETGVLEKCTLCAHRIEQGLEPFCVTCCEGMAMHFGDLGDPNSAISQLIARRERYILLPGHEETGASVHYCAMLKRCGI